MFLVYLSIINTEIYLCLLNGALFHNKKNDN